MQPDAMMEMLKSLKLHGMAQALGELAAQDSPAYKSASLGIRQRNPSGLAPTTRCRRFCAVRRRKHANDHRCH